MYGIHGRDGSRTLLIWAPLLAALIGLVPHEALAQGARLQLDGLNRLKERAAEVVDVTLDPSMLQLAGAFLSADKSADAGVKELVASIRGIYVKSFEFDRDDAYSLSDVKAIRDQLSSRGWSRMVTTESKREQEVTEIYAWRDGGEPGGFAILVLEPREVTVVNIVGPLDLAKLRALEGRFGIPRLPDQNERKE